MAPNDPEVFEGGCLCGSVRYRATALPIDAGWCHCRICQRSAGAPAVAWATFYRRDFSFTAGAPTDYASTNEGRRFFCPHCGAPLTLLVSVEASVIDINICSFDDPARIRPEYHIWTASRVPWFEPGDNLPRYVDEGPDTLR